MKTKLPLLLILLLIPLGCITETYLFSEDEKNTSYVIFALLDQNDTSITVQLSPLSKLYEPIGFNLEDKPNPQIELYQQTSKGTVTRIASKFSWIVEDSNKDDGFIFRAPVSYLSPHNAYWLEISFPDGTRITSEKQYFPTKVAIKKASYSKEDRFYRIQFEDPKNETNYYAINAEINLKDPENEGASIVGNINNKLLDVTDDTIFEGNKNAELAIEIYNTLDSSEKIIEGTLTSLTRSGFIFFNKLMEIYWQTSGFEGDYGPDVDPFSHLFSMPLSDLKSNLFNQNNERVLGAFILTQTVEATPIIFK